MVFGPASAAAASRGVGVGEWDRCDVVDRSIGEERGRGRILSRTSRPRPGSGSAWLLLFHQTKEILWKTDRMQARIKKNSPQTDWTDRAPADAERLGPGEGREGLFAAMGGRGRGAGRPPTASARSTR